MIFCKKCSGQNYSKSGHIRGLQRYICKECGCQFTATKRRGVSPALRKIAIILYAHFGVSLSGVAKLCKVSVQAVVKWIKAAASSIGEIHHTQSQIVQVDEMWHFVNGKKTKFGSGERFVGYHAELSDGTSVIVLTKA
jgi:transposase